MQKLCTGCGICLSVCPRNAISTTNIGDKTTISIDSDLCTNCELCIKLCQALANVYGREIFRINKLDVLGDIKAMLFCYAANHKTRYHGASGGVVTALLCYMLKRKLIDGAIVVRMKGFTPHPYLARNEEECISASGSVYFKTFSLRIILNAIKSGKRIAIVSLPCQTSTLLKLLRLYGIVERFFLISLICGHVNETWYLHHVLRKFMPRIATPVCISPRRDGWPGGLKISFIEKEKAKQVTIPLELFWGPLPLLHFSSPLGCLFCTDHLATSADITVGDAWHPKFLGKDNIGTSLVIVRTKRGLELIDGAIRDGVIYAEKARFSDLLISHGTLIEESKYSIIRRIVYGKPHLLIKYLLLGCSRCLLAAILPLLNNNVARFRLLRLLLLSSTASKLLYYLYSLVTVLQVHKGGKKGCAKRNT